MAPKNRRIGRLVFLRNDLHCIKTPGQTGFSQLALLVAKVALRDHEQAISPRKHRERFGNALEEFNRMLEHCATELDQSLNLIGRDFARRELDGGFDCREHETFYPVAIKLE